MLRQYFTMRKYVTMRILRGGRGAVRGRGGVFFSKENHVRNSRQKHNLYITSAQQFWKKWELNHTYFLIALSTRGSLEKRKWNISIQDEKRQWRALLLFSQDYWRKIIKGKSKWKMSYIIHWFTAGRRHQTTLRYLTRWQIFYTRERKYIYIIWSWDKWSFYLLHGAWLDLLKKIDIYTGERYKINYLYQQLWSWRGGELLVFKVIFNLNFFLDQSHLSMF